MLIDEITIKVEAGNGGRGAVAFNKNMMSLGPAGGSGGRGGSIIFEGVSDLSRLNQFRFKKDIKAENGQDGRPQFVDGKSGKDLIIQIPVGTVIHNLDTKEEKEIILINEQIILAKGGRGGKGNFHFRSPRNTSPKIAQNGKLGESFLFKLELKMIADVGLIGLPNAGKTSLLNSLTKASAKVGNYAFTTLEPNLGAYYELIIADLPGLIEGASIGKGLGMKFLKHIERTKELFHLISAESENPILDYKIIRNELATYSKNLSHKPEVVFLSKADLLKDEEISKIIKLFNKEKISITPISSNEDDLLLVKKELNKIAKSKIKIITP